MAIKAKYDMQRTELIGVCWDYLRKNFNRFPEEKKITIALTLCQKDMVDKKETNFSGDLKIVIVPNDK